MPVEPLSKPDAKRDGSDSLPSYESIRSGADFRRILDDGQRRRSGGIVLASAPGVPGPPRLGLVVSRRCGNAVRRNRIKRRLRAVADQAQLKPGNDYVIIASSQVAEIEFSKLKTWIERALGDPFNA